MSKSTLTAKDLAGLVRTYGGVIGAIEYGVAADSIADPEIANAWRQIERQYQVMSPSLSVVARILYKARAA
jgi:hypothetical protein